MNPLPQIRFNAARTDIEREPCLSPLRVIAWSTVEDVPLLPHYRWRDRGNGVLYLLADGEDDQFSNAKPD